MTDRRPSPLWQLTLARMRMFFREPSAVFWTFGFPILLSLSLGVAFRNRPPEAVRIAIERSADTDGGAAERLQRALKPYSQVEVIIDDPATARAALRAGKVALVIVPQPGGADAATATYRFDPTRPESRLARALVDDAVQRAAGRADPLKVSDSLVSEPGARYIDFLIPGLIGMNVMQSGMWGVGYLIVEFRTRKLIKRMVATPMKHSHFLISFLLLRMVFFLLEVPILLTFARFVFGVRVHGPVALFFGLALLGSLLFASLGMLIASRAENTQTVNGLINVVSLPMFMFSGVFFATSNFPEVIQPVIRLLPLTLLNDSLRRVLNDGAGVMDVLPAMGLMAAWSVVSMVLALRLFRWR